MIHEFAIEPELAAKWGALSEFRHFVQAFGVGTARIVSRYPKDWKQLVWDAAHAETEIARKRLEVLISTITRTTVRRGGVYGPTTGWLANANTDHNRSPFSGILARNGDSRGPILGIDNIDDAPSWNCPRGITCKRTSAAIAAALAPTLRNCRRVAFIDPHFGPDSGRHRRTLSAFLRVLMNQRPGGAPDEVLVLTSTKATPDFFMAECQKRLPRLVPRGLTISIRRLQERAGKEKLHNRYVLTDIGGIVFGVGLDEGDPTSNDDLNIMSAEQYTLRHRQYLSSEMEFDIPEAPVTVVGIAKA